MPQYLGLFIPNQEIQWPIIKEVSLNFEKKLYIFDQNSLSDIKRELNVEESYIDIFPSSEFHLRDHVVRANPVIEAIKVKVDQYFQTHNLIIFLEMTWAVRSPSGDIYLRELQEALQAFLINKEITLVCIYNESIMLDEQLLLGLFSHPKILTENEIKENPYYLPPEIIKRNHLKSRFNYWLNKIDTNHAKSKGIFTQKEEINSEVYAVEKSFLTKIAQSTEGRWKIRCFGELRIHRENGELIEWNTKAGSTKKMKTLFAFLLLKGEKGATSEELADLLWPDAETTEQGLNRLYHSIRYLRIILGGENDGSSFISYQNSIYYLKLPFDSWIDLPMFQELCFKGNQHIQEQNIEQAKICYEAAERLYSGDLFHDIPLKYIENNDNDWCWSKRYWYSEMYHKLLYSMAKIYRELGNLSVAINYCDKALAEDPLLEAAHIEKLITLAASQRFDALHRQFRIYTDSLRKFNNSQPSAEIRTIYLNLSKKN
jgi:two-component SAPR family response regulator